MLYKTKLVVFLTIAIICGLAQPVSTDGKAASEYEVKAACLYNFANFVEWPSKAFANESSPIIIGVLGEDPFGNALEQALQDRSIGGRKLVAKRFKRIRDLETCHILFICASEKNDIPKIIDAIKNTPTLTVSDIDKFAEKGGIIGFVLQNKKLGFEINLDAANKANLKISSKLLKMSKIV